MKKNSKGLSVILILLVASLGYYFFVYDKDVKKEAAASQRIFSKTTVMTGETFTVNYIANQGEWSLKEKPPFPPDEQVTFAGSYFRVYVSTSGMIFHYTAPTTPGTYTFSGGQYCVGEGCGWLTYPSVQVTVVDCVPTTEVCDNKDNDCDGQIDEGVKNACGNCGAVPTEVCNGIDDDCDGTADENPESICGSNAKCVSGGCKYRNTAADTDFDGCVSDSEFPVSIINWKNQANGITDSVFGQAILKWQSQEGCLK